MGKQMLFFPIVVGLCVIISTTSAFKPPVFICYWGSWYNIGSPGNFSLENFDPNACTHLIYSFVTIDNENSVIKWQDGNYENDIAKMKELKSRNNGLKLMIAIGGADGEVTRAFQGIAANVNRSRTFVDSIIREINRGDWDGIDIDWEFPEVNDRVNYVELIKNLKQKMNCLAFEKSRSEFYVLTAAVSPSPYKIAGYDIEALDEYLDYWNLMVYDYHFYSRGDDDILFQHHSPTYDYGNNSNFNASDMQKQLNANESIQAMINGNASVEKLVLGFGTYGHTWEMEYPLQHDVGDLAHYKGPAGPWRKEVGNLGYSEFCFKASGDALAGRPWTFVFDKKYQSPYAYNVAEKTWIAFDDERGVIAKTDLAMGNHTWRPDQILGGMMVWSIELDDCNNLCGGWVRCPLITAVKNRLDFWKTYWESKEEEGEGATTEPPEVPGKEHCDAITTSTTTSTTTVAPPPPP